MLLVGFSIHGLLYIRLSTAGFSTCLLFAFWKKYYKLFKAGTPNEKGSFIYYFLKYKYVLKNIDE